MDRLTQGPVVWERILRHFPNQTERQSVMRTFVSVVRDSGPADPTGVLATVILDATLKARMVFHTKEARAFQDRLVVTIRDHEEDALAVAEYLFDAHAAAASSDTLTGRATVTAAELLQANLPEPIWAIRGVLPPGFSLLAGKPKAGKSWLALGLALAIGMGGIALGSIEVEQGPVLYMGLEDTYGRLQGRIGRLGGRSDLHSLVLACDCPALNLGGSAWIEERLAELPGLRLVVVDTIAKVRPARRGGGSMYDEDYALAAELKRLADEWGVPILGLHHTRKAVTDDAFESISGTFGLTGGADALIVLKRTSETATLHITGRDIGDCEMPLKWDANLCLWSTSGDGELEQMSAIRQRIVAALQQNAPLGHRQIAEALGEPYANVRQRVYQMLRAGQIEKVDGERFTVARNVHNNDNMDNGQAGRDNSDQLELPRQPVQAPPGEGKPLSGYAGYERYDGDGMGVAADGSESEDADWFNPLIDDYVEVAD